MADPKNTTIHDKADTAKMSLQKQSHKGASSYPLNHSSNRLTIPTNTSTYHEYVQVALKI